MSTLRRWLRVLAVSTMLTVSAPSDAQAMPFLAAPIAAFASTQLGGILISTAVSVATSFGASLLKNLFGGSAAQSRPNLAMRLAVATGGVVAQSFLMGDWATAGSMNYRGSWGEAEGAPNAYYVEERVLSDVPMPALTGFLFGAQRGTILWAEPHPDGRGYPVSEARRGGIDHMWVNYRNGSQTTADPYLRAKFGAAHYPYTAAMIGRGRAVAIVTRKVPNEDNRDLFPANLEYKFESSGIALYDLSKDSSAGGFGTHRWDDPSTWEPSGNTAVQVYNVLRGIRWGTEWLFGLQTMHPARLPASAWIAGITECNVIKTNADGSTEPQFRTGCEVSVDMEAAGVIEELLAGATGRIAEIGGIYKPLFGAPGAAVYSFTDADIVVTRDQGFAPFPRLEQTFNAVKPKYVEPASGWELKDAPARYSAEQEAEDGGRRLAASVTLKTVNKVTRVQRVVKVAHEEQRRWRRHQLGWAPATSELEPLDVVSWSSAENGYIDKKFLIEELDDEPTYLQVGYIAELDPADYDYDAEVDEKPSFAAPIGPVRPPVQVATAWSVVGLTVNRKPTARWTWDADMDDVRGVAFRARIRAGIGAGTMVLSESTDLVSLGVIDYAGGLLQPGQQLEGQLRYLARSARRTDWPEDWLPFDLPDTRLGLIDLVNSFQNTVGFIDDPDKGLSASLTDLRARLAKLAATQTSTTVEADHQIRALEATFGASSASFLEQVSVVATATEASGLLLTLITASLNDSTAAVGTVLDAYATADAARGTLINEVAVSAAAGSAGGFFKIEATVDEDEVAAKMVAKVRRTKGGVTSNAGWMVDWVVDEWRFAVFADQFWFVTADGSYAGSPFYILDGVAYIENAVIKNLSLGTGKLAPNAATEATIAYQVLDAGPTGTYITQVVPVAADDDITGVLITFFALADLPVSDPSNFGRWRTTLFRNGISIDVSAEMPYDDNYGYPVPSLWFDPAPGVNPTYTIGGITTVGPGNFLVKDGIAVFTLLKR